MFQCIFISNCVKLNFPVMEISLPKCEVNLPKIIDKKVLYIFKHLGKTCIEWWIKFCQCSTEQFINEVYCPTQPR
jgi:hypothetical protein